MLQSRHLIGNPKSFRHDFVAVGMNPFPGAKDMSILVDVLLQTENELDLPTLYDEIWISRFKEPDSVLTNSYPTEQFAMFRVLSSMTIYTTTELLLDHIERTAIAIGHGCSDLKANMDAVRLVIFAHGHTSIGIEKTSKIGNVLQLILQVLNEKMANSGNIRCPARKGAEGQSRTKQERKLWACVTSMCHPRKGRCALNSAGM